METTVNFQEIPLNAILAFSRYLILAGIAFILVRYFKSIRKYAIYRVKTFDGQISFELRTALLICLFDAIILALANYFNLFPKGNPTILNHILTFTGMFIWFEGSLYFVHRLLHTKRFYWIHRHHHKSMVTTPFTAISSSLMDRIIGIVVPFVPVVLLDKFAGISATQLGLISYFMLLFIINIYSHINVEVIPTWIVKNKFLGKVLITPSFHSLHHARHQGNYGITTPLMDILFNTHFLDYEKVHEKSRAGEGLSKIGERLGPRRKKVSKKKKINQTPAPVLATVKVNTSVSNPIPKSSR